MLRIIPVIKSVGNRLFHRGLRIIKVPQALRAIREFYHVLAKHRGFKKRQHSVYKLRHTSVKYGFVKIIRVAYPSIGENDDLRLSIGEELFRMLAKHHGGRVFQNPVF